MNSNVPVMGRPPKHDIAKITDAIRQIAPTEDKALVAGVIHRRIQPIYGPIKRTSFGNILTKLRADGLVKRYQADYGYIYWAPLEKAVEV